MAHEGGGGTLAAARPAEPQPEVGMEKAGQTRHPDQARYNIGDLAEFLASPGTLHWGSLLCSPLIRAISPSGEDSAWLLKGLPEEQLQIEQSQGMRREDVVTNLVCEVARVY